MIMFTATLIGGGCDYLFQILMGRSLGPESYSELNALLSIFYIVIVPTQAIGTFLARYTSKFKAEGNHGGIAWLMRKALVYALVLGVLIVLGLLIAMPHLIKFISLTSTLPVFILMAGVLIVMVAPVGYGPTQGLQRFHLSGLYGVAGPLGKLVFGLILTAAGFGVAGAIGGVVVGSFFATIVGLLAVKDYFMKPRVPVSKDETTVMSKYVLTVTAAIAGWAILINIDIFMARQYLPPYEAGLYSVASVLGKVIYFLSGGVCSVLLPKVSDYHARKKRTIEMMRVSALLTFSITIIVAIAYLLFPTPILDFLYGNVYVDAAPVLSVLGLAMVFFSLCGLFLNYGLAIASRFYVTIFSIFTVLQVALIMMFHDSAVEIALDLLATSICLLIVSWTYMEMRAKAERF
ncbi:MAG: oligosaccharide flippase family protein [Methanomassiliicoccales archaeon]|nr:oligosaccharide flippase family protein [Methanomassiliicoccales archaeon]